MHGKHNDRNYIMPNECYSCIIRIMIAMPNKSYLCMKHKMIVIILCQMNAIYASLGL